MNLILLLILAMGAWANPFSAYLKPARENDRTFHRQQAPFAYPFEVTKEVLSQYLSLGQVIDQHPQDALRIFEALYQKIPFDSKLSLYRYTFPIRPEWEFLPYGYVSDLEGTNPRQWIPEFNRLPDFGKGVRSVEFHNRLDEVTKSRAFAGNKLKLLKTPLAYAELQTKISSARDHVLLSTFLFQCDTGTEPLLQLMQKKISEGVSFYVIIDQLLSAADPKCKRRLRQMGVKLMLRGKMTKVFHEKMLIVDGKFALVDGQNLLGPQVLSDGTNNLINDNAVGVEGPIVAQIARHFILHWEQNRKRPLPLEIKNFYQRLLSDVQKAAEPEAVSQALKDGSGLCRLVTKGPYKNERQILDLYLETVKASQTQLFFNFIELSKDLKGKNPGSQFLRAVVGQANAISDLRVDMLTNNWKRPTDIFVEGMDTRNLFSKVVTAAGLAVAGPQYKSIPSMRTVIKEKLTNENFHWWSYSQYMHSKTLLSDNIWTLIGSYNINAASQYASYEQTLACLDKDLARQMQGSVVLDVLNSIPIPLK